MNNLNAAFAAFVTSASNKATPPPDDWRERQARVAAVNGDTYTDQHPTDEFSEGYFDPDYLFEDEA